MGSEVSSFVRAYEISVYLMILWWGWQVLSSIKIGYNCHQNCFHVGCSHRYFLNRQLICSWLAILFSVDSSNLVWMLSWAQQAVENHRKFQPKVFVSLWTKGSLKFDKVWSLNWGQFFLFNLKISVQLSHLNFCDRHPISVTAFISLPLFAHWVITNTHTHTHC